MVNSEMIISENAEKVLQMSISQRDCCTAAHLKTPNRSALKAPNPAAAEKLPRSMIPLETKTLYLSTHPTMGYRQLTRDASCG